MPCELRCECDGQQCKAWRTIIRRSSMLFRKQTGVVMAAVILFSVCIEAQEDESRIPLRGDSWVQMSGEEIAWPAEGEALELAPGQAIASKAVISAGRGCVITLRVAEAPPDRDVQWEVEKDDAAWGLRNQDGTELLSFRLVGNQGFLDIRDKENPGPAALPKPDEYAVREVSHLPRWVGGPIVHFIDQPPNLSYANSLSYRFAIAENDVMARVHMVGPPDHGWTIDRLVNPRGPMSVWIKAGRGALVVESVETIDATGLAVTQSYLNRRKFQERYDAMEDKAERMRADFDLDAVEEYHTTVDYLTDKVVVTRQMSTLRFDRGTCRIGAVNVDGIELEGLSLPDLVAVDESGTKYYQSLAADGQINALEEKFEVVIDGEFTPRDESGRAYETSFLVRYTIHKMNGLVALEVAPSEVASARRLSLEHHLGQTERGLDLYYQEGEIGPNDASLRWAYSWDVGRFDLTKDGPVSLYNNGDQPINRAHFLTIHDGHVGVQFLPITWNHARLNPSSLYRVSTGGWALEGESLTSKAWQTNPDTTGGKMCLVLHSRGPDMEAHAEELLPPGKYDVWLRFRGSMELTINETTKNISSGESLSWHEFGAITGGKLNVLAKQAGKEEGWLDTILILPPGQTPPEEKPEIAIGERNFHKMTVTAERGAAVVHMTFVNEPEAVSLNPKKPFIYAFGFLPPKRWKPQHDNPTSLEPMFWAQKPGYTSDDDQEWARGWRNDWPETPAVINATAIQAGMTLTAINQGGTFGVGWPIEYGEVLRKILSEARRNWCRTFGYTDVAVGQSGTLIEKGYYSDQELRDQALVKIPHWMVLSSRTWRAHCLMRTEDILNYGFDQMYYDSTNMFATLVNRFGWNNTLGLQRFYEDDQLLFRAMGKEGGLVIHAWGQIPLVNVGLADMTLPGEQYWLGKRRSGYLDEEAQKASYNSYLAGCQVQALGAGTAPIEDPGFYHQMLGYGWYQWFNYYPKGVTEKVMKRVPPFSEEQLKVYRRYHDPLSIFDTRNSRAIDYRSPEFPEVIPELAAGTQAIVYSKPGRAMVVVAKDLYFKGEKESPGLTINLVPLGIDEHFLMFDADTTLVLDADTVELADMSSADGRVTLTGLDLTGPKMIVLLSRPSKPGVIWRDVQTRKVFVEKVKGTTASFVSSWAKVFAEKVDNGQLSLELGGVPNSKSRVLVWLGEEARWMDVEYPEGGKTQLSVHVGSEGDPSAWKGQKKVRLEK